MSQMPLLLKDKIVEIENRVSYAWNSAHEAIAFARRSKLKERIHHYRRGLDDARHARRVAHVYQKGLRNLREKARVVLPVQH